ncbi:sensor histidine kinase [Promicromonospora sp. NPDC050880]|uniref:sensor histidine kinase n=1 Tax=Promicromonospora sp. NPDC050880 TaxID=3364406 RepID=UPI0037B07D76
MRTTRESLQWQTWVVAGLCMVVDGADTLLNGGLGGGGGVVLIVAVLLVDATLATPARYSGWVAALHSVFWVVATMASGVNPGDDGGMLVAGYRAGAWLRGLPAVGALLALASCTVATGLLTGSSVDAASVVELIKVAVLPWLVGRYTSARRAYLATLEQQEERERRDAQEAVRAAVAEERSAIARDLHDVIVHHVSAISMHAGAVRLRLSAATAGASGAVPTALEGLRSVETSSRAAMVDLRHLLDVLHGTLPDGARQPGLDNLEELFDGVRKAGMPATLHVLGSPREIPQSLDVALYRVVQEMLTNALRHGDASGVEVTLTYGDAGLAVVADNRVGADARPAGSGSGRGLAGIRQRVGVFGGRAEHGLRPDGTTWRTTAVFPLTEDPGPQPRAGAGLEAGRT